MLRTIQSAHRFGFRQDNGRRRVVKEGEQMMLTKGYDQDPGPGIPESADSKELPSLRTYSLRWEYDRYRSVGRLTLTPNFASPGVRPQSIAFLRWRPMLPDIESEKSWKQLDPDDIRLNPFPFGLLVRTVLDQASELPMTQGVEYTLVGYRTQKSKKRISLLLINAAGEDRVLTIAWQR